MKTCKFCNNVVEDEAMFCNNCGQRFEEPVQPTYEQPVYQQPAYGQPQQAYGQPQQPVYGQLPYGQPYAQGTTESFFDGTLLQQIGWNLLAILISICTCGIAFPWAYCMLLSWETKHTVINGRRLTFDGTGGQLIGNWLLWMLLSAITCGIYGLWVGIKLKQWVVKHTHFEN